MQGIPIGPITRGLMDGVADAERQAATYRDGVNVRGIDPRTGKAVWGAQRAGLSEFGDNPGDGYPTLLLTTFRQRRAREWAELDTTADSTIVPTQVGFDWETQLESAAVACATGPDGQGYFLLDNGVVVILGLSGKVSATVESATPYGYEVVPTLIIADDGSIIVACSTTAETTLARGRVRRYVRQEDKRWTLSWESEFDDPVVAIGYNNGSLFVALEPLPDQNNFVADARLARIGAPLLGPEVLWNREGLPRPIFDLQVNDRGEAIISSPSNPRREFQSQGFGERKVEWIPSMDASWETKGWSWVDAWHVDDSTTGVANATRIQTLRDRRFDESQFYRPDETSPQRTLTTSRASFPRGPEFDQSAFGGAGGLFFDTECALGTDFNEDTGNDNAYGLIPNGPLQGDPDTLRNFVFAYVVQLIDDTETDPRLLFHQTGQDTAVAPMNWRAEGNLGAATVLNYATPNSTGNDSSVDAVIGGSGTRSSVVVWDVEESGGTVTVDFYVDGTSVGSRTLTGTIDSFGEFAFAEQGSGFYQDVKMPGSVFALGGYRPNAINLSLPHPASGVGSWFKRPASRLNDDVDHGWDAAVRLRCYRTMGSTASPFTYIDPTTGDYTGAATFAENKSPSVFHIDLGADVVIDGVSFDGLYRFTSERPREVQVRFVQSDGTVLETVVIDTEEPGTYVWAKHFGQINAIGGGSAELVRYVQVAFWDDNSNLPLRKYHIRQFRVHNQRMAKTAAVTYPPTTQFNFGEIVSAYTSTDSVERDEYRQKLEGYLAWKFGLQGQLPGGGSPHPYKSNPPAGTGTARVEDSGRLSYALRSPYPILAKFNGDGFPMSAFTGAGVGLGCALYEDKVVTVGEAVSALSQTQMVRTFTDDGRRFVPVDEFLQGTEVIQRRRTPLAFGPTQQVYAAISTRAGSTGPQETIRLFTSSLAQTWSFDLSGARCFDLTTSGFQINETSRLGASGSEYLLAAFRTDDQARKLSTMGLKDTGQVSGRDAEYIAVMSSGAVKRKNDLDGWDTLGNGGVGALPGRTLGAATLYGNTFIADGLDYRVYNHATGALRVLADDAVGGIPPRCELIAAYSGRLVLARGDNAFTVYQSRYGDPFDFDYGPEVQSISQAIAGTVASQGKPPEPITALMPFRDSRLYIGTTESLFVQTGDLADGGRLDQLDKSQGVAPGYAWCESASGIYYFSARGGVNFLNAQSQISIVSYGSVQRRLEEIDLTRVQVRLCYNWVDKTVHVFVLSNNVGSDVEHYVYDEALGAWHKDSFGSGFENAVTTAATQHGDSPEDRALLIGFGDGNIRRWDQYAQDDAGKPIQSYAMVGPLISGREGIETRIQGLYGQLATDQGPVEVAVRASNSADAPGPPGTFARLEPGRGLGVGVNASAPALYVDVRGLGTAWAVHELRGEISAESDVRSTS